MLHPELITNIAQVTSGWLTLILAHAGYLQTEQVVAVRVVNRQETGFHIIVQLQVTYSQETAAPSHLILKYSQPDRHVRVPERGWEVVFYTHLAAQMPLGPILRCYHAAFSPQLGKVHLLLEDVSATHYAQPPSHLPPILPECYRIIDALARLHAHWWERPPFGLAKIHLPDDVDIQDRVRASTQRIMAFEEMLGDRLSDERRHIYRDVLRAMPHLFQRLTANHGFTVVHSDVHIGNFLYPHDPATDTIRMIDWQTWNIDLAVKDLAYMMSYFWFPERRMRYEQPLLQYYHERLQTYGVLNYAWQTLFDDYRLCVIRLLFHPAWQWENGEPTSKAWLHLERIMLAYHDLGCAELVEHNIQHHQRSP